MFVATLSNGTVIAEGKDVEHFDQMPDGKITSIQLLLNYAIYKKVGDKTLKRRSVLAIGRYDKYYCAKQAVANIMSVAGGVGHFMNEGQGTVTHEIIAGIDLKRNEVVYIELNVTTGDVKIDKFDYDKWIKETGLNESLLKSGAPRKSDPPQLNL